jgi:hypothetical protein
MGDNKEISAQDGSIIRGIKQSTATNSYDDLQKANDEDKIIHQMIEIHRSEIENVGKQLARKGQDRCQKILSDKLLSLSLRLSPLL